MKLTLLRKMSAALLTSIIALCVSTFAFQNIFWISIFWFTSMTLAITMFVTAITLRR